LTAVKDAGRNGVEERAIGITAVHPRRDQEQTPWGDLDDLAAPERTRDPGEGGRCVF
jgi:hypothetical protein